MDLHDVCALICAGALIIEHELVIHSLQYMSVVDFTLSYLSGAVQP